MPFFRKSRSPARTVTAEVRTASTASHTEKRARLHPAATEEGAAEPPRPARAERFGTCASVSCFFYPQYRNRQWQSSAGTNELSKADAITWADYTLMEAECPYRGGGRTP